MSETTGEKEFLSSLDRRVMDHDAKISGIQRDYTEIGHEIKEVLNRINGGLSPSVNEVRKENSEIRLAIKDMAHQMKMDQLDMKGMVRETTEHTRLMIDNFEKNKIAPVVEEVSFMKKTFIYGLVGAVIAFMGHKAIDLAWDKVFKPEPPPVSAKKN